MTSPLTHYHWPVLDEPYATALRQAVAFIQERYHPLGIVASGTILRGNPAPNSDLDIYVIHADPLRQRVQRRFNGVPAEIFVNPLAAIERYFAEERRAARPLTAHMLATGVVVLDRDPVVERLRQRSEVLASTPPDPTPPALTMRRYGLATQIEDAFDMAATDPDTAVMIAAEAVHGLLQYYFWQENRNLPRDKDLLATVSATDPALGQIARHFYRAATPAERLALAGELADRIIGVRGFFEWESEPDMIEDYLPEAMP